MYSLFYCFYKSKCMSNIHYTCTSNWCINRQFYSIINSVFLVYHIFWLKSCPYSLFWLWPAYTLSGRGCMMYSCFVPDKVPFNFLLLTSKHCSQSHVRVKWKQNKIVPWLTKTVSVIHSHTVHRFLISVCVNVPLYISRLWEFKSLWFL